MLYLGFLLSFICTKTVCFVGWWCKPSYLQSVNWFQVKVVYSNICPELQQRRVWDASDNNMFITLSERYRVSYDRQTIEDGMSFWIPKKKKRKYEGLRHLLERVTPSYNQGSVAFKIAWSIIKYTGFCFS